MSDGKTTGIAFVGTGFVSDYYMATLANHPQLRLTGVFDVDGSRLSQFCGYWAVKSYGTVAELLADPAVDIVVNLTTPESHFAVNEAALMAGKHVYCEKPLAMTVEEARRLVDLARARNLTLAGAPANALSDAQAHCKAILASGAIGTPRLAYAEMEDGPVFLDNWREWKSRSGARWPGVHEFEIGCTLEHAGYATGWLVSLFGPVARLDAFAALTFPDKGPGTGGLTLAPDFSVGCLHFKSGLVARLTSGLAAPRDRSLTVVGDKGTLVVRDLWDNRSPIHVEHAGRRRPLLHRIIDRLERHRGRRFGFRLTPGKAIAYTDAKSVATLPAYPSQIDFVRGIAAQAAAIGQGAEPFFAGERALHLTDIVLALNAGRKDYTPSPL